MSQNKCKYIHLIDNYSGSFNNIFIIIYTIINIITYINFFFEGDIPNTYLRIITTRNAIIYNSSKIVYN